jgi:hypothetical protein
MMEVIDRYINEKCRPGGFLEAVICNDLKAAVENADDENMANLPAFVGYFYNEAPFNCWGSKEKMENWLKSKIPISVKMDDEDIKKISKEARELSAEFKKKTNGMERKEWKHKHE